MTLTIRQWRRAKEITQEQMAEKLGVHVNTYQNWEESPGKISVTKAVQIAEIFGVTLDDILFQNESI